MNNGFKDISEISMEQLIEAENNYSPLSFFVSGKEYCVSTLIKIKEKINEILKDVPNPPQDDPDREKKIFSYIYVKLGELIKYDELSASALEMKGSYYSDAAYDRIERAKGLECLLTGEALCSGYSVTLVNVLAECGIKATYISGGVKDKHAWNQVLLDGKWYNCDLTNDADFIVEGLKLPYFLKSNEEFGKGDYHRYTQFPVQMDVENCLESVSDEQQEHLLTMTRTHIEQSKGKDIMKKELVEKETFFVGVVKFIKSRLGIKEEKNRVVDKHGKR